MSEARDRAFKETSADRDKTIGDLIEESLDFYGIESRQDAAAAPQKGSAKLSPKRD